MAKITCKIMIMSILFVAAFLAAITAYFINKGKRWYGPTPCLVKYIEKEPYAKIVGAQPLSDKYPKNSIYQPVKFYNSSVTYNGTESCWIKTQGTRNPATISLLPKSNPDFKKRSNDAGYTALGCLVGGIIMVIINWRTGEFEAIPEPSPTKKRQRVDDEEQQRRHKQIKKNTVEMVDKNTQQMRNIERQLHYSSDPPSINDDMVEILVDE